MTSETDDLEMLQPPEDYILTLSDDGIAIVRAMNRATRILERMFDWMQETDLHIKIEIQHKE